MSNTAPKIAAPKIAIVTGATSGFGDAIARRLVAEGWRIVATGRRQDRLDALVEALGGPDVVHPLCFDIRDEAATRAALATLPDAFADISILVNNAGLALGTGAAQDCDLEQWRTMIDTNITGLVTITRLLLARLIAQRGLIVNLASVASNWPYPGGNVYGGTKAFVRQFSLGLRSDLSAQGVRVTSIEPGLAESEFTLVRTGGNKDAYDTLYAGANPLQPEDIAETVRWVVSLPPHVNINSVEIMPVSQSWAPFKIHRDTPAWRIRDHPAQSFGAVAGAEWLRHRRYTSIQWPRPGFAPALPPPERVWPIMTLAFHMMPLVGTILLLASRRVSLLSAGIAGMALALVTMVAPMLMAQPSAGPVLGLAAVKAGEGAWLAWHAMSIIAAGLLFHRAFEARGTRTAAVAQENRRRAVFVACFLVGPFAESVTGFGVGLVVALAMLRSLGLPPVQSAALGLFSQVLAAWGAMGVGSRVGAELIGVSFTELGTASALLMAVVLPCLLPVFWGLIQSSGLRSTLRERATDVALLLCLAGLIWLTNRFVAPELGGGLATAVLLLVVEGPRLLRSGTGVRELAERLWPYGLLIAGLMATRLLPPLSDWTGQWLVLDPFGGLAPLALLRHPATWLVLIAGILLAGLPSAEAGKVVRGALRAALVPMAATLVFVEFATFMAASGGAAMFGNAWREVAGRFAVLASPVFGAAAGMLTGSNTASNALMMHIQLSLAAESGLPSILIAAVQTVAGSICTMLTPGRIVLAAGLVGLERSEGAIYRRALPIGLATILALLAVIVAMTGFKAGGLV